MPLRFLVGQDLTTSWGSKGVIGPMTLFRADIRLWPGRWGPRGEASWGFKAEGHKALTMGALAKISEGHTRACSHSKNAQK